LFNKAPDVMVGIENGKICLKATL